MNRQLGNLSENEFASLAELGKGVLHGPISPQDAARLLELGLAYRLLGNLRMTRAGRARLKPIR